MIGNDWKLAELRFRIVETGTTPNPDYPDIDHLKQFDRGLCNYYAKVSDGSVHCGTTKAEAIGKAEGYVERNLH